MDKFYCSKDEVKILNNIVKQLYLAGTNLISQSAKEEIGYLSYAAIQRWKNDSDRSTEWTPSPIVGCPEEIQDSYPGDAYY